MATRRRKAAVEASVDSKPTEVPAAKPKKEPLIASALGNKKAPESSGGVTKEQGRAAAARLVSKELGIPINNPAELRKALKLLLDGDD